MSVHIKVNERLNEMSKSRYWLSKKTGITYTNICRLCADSTTSINFKTLDKICDVLECEPGDILIKT